MLDIKSLRRGEHTAVGDMGEESALAKPRGSLTAGAAFGYARTVAMTRSEARALSIQGPAGGKRPDNPYDDIQCPACSSGSY